MSGIKHISQIDMTVPPTEDNHVVRKKELSDVNYEISARLDLFETILRDFCGDTSLPESVLHYDALNTIRYYAESMNLSNEDAIAHLNAQSTESFRDESASGSHAAKQNRVVWHERGARVNAGAVTNSYIALPIGGVNSAIRSDNYTVMTAMTLDAAGRRNNWFGDFGIGVNASFEIKADNTLRWYRNASPDLSMPGSAWTAVAGKPLYMAVAVSRSGNSFDLDIYIDGVHLWHNAFTNSTYLSDTNVEFWWGNDRRQDASICTKGTLHSLKIYNKHLSNYDVLKSMRADMERYN